jgi:hypothetical protein
MQCKGYRHRSLSWEPPLKTSNEDAYTTLNCDMGSFKRACFISLNPKHWKKEQKKCGKTTKVTLATKGAHTQHSF